MSITYPRGFRAAAVKAGIKPSGKIDLALIVRERGAAHAASAAAFTTNQILGAPVIIGQEQRAATLKGGAALRAVLVNAGNSNAATGEQGLADARACMKAAAEAIGCAAGEVLVSSTGVIGRLLPTAKITGAGAGLAAALAQGADADAAAAAAIMTTDLVAKTARREVEINGCRVRIGAIAKGSGMIAPKLDCASGPPRPSATMLAFITTDAAIESRDLQRVLDEACAGSFNRVSVDNHPSCSDSAIVLASGEARGAGGAGGAGADGAAMAVLKPGSAGMAAFGAALAEVCTDLATQIVVDGEGATRIFKVRVTGAASDAEAERMAREVVNSPLVKCAIHGRDPNWGRIVTAAGNAGVKFDPSGASLTIGAVEVYRAGVPLPHALDDPRLADAMAGKRVECELVVGRGPGSAWMIGCDLSAQYVSINADYTT